MPMAPEAGQLLEIYLDGAAPTLDMIGNLPEGANLRVWDPLRSQTAFVFRTETGGLKIRTGDLQSPEIYDIEPGDALIDAQVMWERAKKGEAKQQQDYIEQSPF